MPKILFTENAVLVRGDGSGPRFEAGQVYLLPEDACARWKLRNKAVDAPDDAPAVNEPARAVRAAPRAAVPDKAVEKPSEKPADKPADTAAKPPAGAAGTTASQASGQK